MRRATASLLSTALVTVCAVAQQPARSSDDILTLKSRSQLVVVDVVVKDKNGQPIHGLPRSTFVVKEDGKPQKISSFEEHQAQAAPAMPPMPTLQPGTFTNFAPVAPDSPLNVLLIDTLNTPVRDQMYLRQQLNEYVKKAQPGQRIAIFGLTSRLIYLQGFTSDPETLKRALSPGNKTLRQSALVDTEMSPGSEYSSINAPLGQIEDAASLFALEEAASRDRIRAQYALEGLNELARFLAGFPGRKNLIWFSGSFPINLLPEQNDMTNLTALYGDLTDEYRETVNLMAAAQVAVYPVDARGVFSAPLLRADSSSGFSTGAPLQAKLEAFHERTGAEHATMAQMAEDTGGKAIINTNDLSTAVRNVIDDGSSYYTLTYSPTNHDDDGILRRINVTLEPGGYKLQYRRAYFAPTKDETKKKQTTSPPNSNLAQRAMRHGAPDPTQIYFTIKVTPVGTEPGGSPTETLAAGNAAAPKLKGPFRTFQVQISADPREMSAALLPDGRRQMDLEFVTVIFSRDGLMQNSITNQLRGALDPQTYKDIFRDGVLLTQSISVPAKGDFYLRTGVLDLNNSKLGAVEIPLAITRKLPAIAEGSAK